MNSYELGQKAAREWRDQPDFDKLPRHPAIGDYNALEQWLGRDPTVYEKQQFARGFRDFRQEHMRMKTIVKEHNEEMREKSTRDKNDEVPKEARHDE